MAERLKAPVLKTGVSKGIQGSNPCPSANSQAKALKKPGFSGLFAICPIAGGFRILGRVDPPELPLPAG